MNNVRKEVKDFMNGAYANNDGWEDIKITSYKIIKEVSKSLDITSSSVDESLKEYSLVGITGVYHNASKSYVKIS